MNHLKPLAIKLFGYFILLYLALGLIFGMSTAGILITAVTLGLLSYFLLDVGMLPRSNEWFALACDLGLSFSIIWGLSRFFIHNQLPAVYVSLGAAVVITVFEHFYHQYLSDYVLRQDVPRRSARPGMNYQTESSEEIRPDIGADKSNGNKQ
ncbi:YndM family protein [Heyndrickxia acidiproducens]|uniref:YndM family protein n=1 Tax=Heyndrickxia acidiproducens TaxID=1121084 RepID=UPI00035D67D0|nr:YndM family protein [Heyndrickxia acidiproducens]